jgi:hypothetical protein
MKIDRSEINRFAIQGMTVNLWGMELMLERMQGEVSNLRTLLALHHEFEGEQKPALSEKRAQAGKRGWGGMTAEERSAEMRRRIEVRKQNQAAAAGLHPRDPNHPNHEEWVAKMSKIRKQTWAKKTKAEKEAWKAAMKAGKAKELKQPMATVKLAGVA